MATAPIAPPHSAVDLHGRALPMSDDEVRRRADAIARGLKALDDMGDEDEQRQTLDTLMEVLDEDRTSYRNRSV